MFNEEILNKRWVKTEKLLKRYSTIIDKYGVEVIDKIINVISSLDVNYNDLNKNISSSNERLLNKKIKKWKKQGILNGYFAFLIKSKNKITYGDLIEILVYGIYAEQENNIDELSNIIFKEVASDIYKQAEEEVGMKSNFSLTWEFIKSLLWIPNYNKNYYDYLKLLTMNNEQETFKVIMGKMQQNQKLRGNDLIDLVKKQNKRVICINDDKFSGVLSDTCRALGNDVYYNAFKEESLQVRFIAEIDKKTTKMCEGMNGMLFNVDGWNKFYRYSELDKKDVLYTVKGLERGINLPPINNHFHWCRSTITYLIDEDTKKIKNDKKEIGICRNQDYVIGSDGNKYFVDGINVILDHTKNEEEIAKWYAENKDLNIKMLPRVISPPNIKTGDFVEDTSKEIWEIKEPIGNTLGTTILNQFKGQKEKAHNFIVDMHLSEMSDDLVIKEIEKILSSKRYDWIEKVILLRDKKLIKEFTK